MRPYRATMNFMATRGQLSFIFFSFGERYLEISDPHNSQNSQIIYTYNWRAAEPTSLVKKISTPR